MLYPFGELRISRNYATFAFMCLWGITRPIKHIEFVNEEMIPGRDMIFKREPKNRQFSKMPGVGAMYLFFQSRPLFGTEAFLTLDDETMVV